MQNIIAGYKISSFFGLQLLIQYIGSHEGILNTLTCLCNLQRLQPFRKRHTSTMNQSDHPNFQTGDTFSSSENAEDLGMAHADSLSGGSEHSIHHATTTSDSGHDGIDAGATHGQPLEIGWVIGRNQDREPTLDQSAKCKPINDKTSKSEAVKIDVSDNVAGEIVATSSNKFAKIETLECRLAAGGRNLGSETAVKQQIETKYHLLALPRELRDRFYLLAYLDEENKPFKLLEKYDWAISERVSKFHNKRAHVVSQTASVQHICQKVN